MFQWGGPGREVECGCCKKNATRDTKKGREREETLLAMSLYGPTDFSCVFLMQGARCVSIGVRGRGEGFSHIQLLFCIPLRRLLDSSAFVHLYLFFDVHRVSASVEQRSL